MNCYNGAKFLQEAVDSVIAQTYTNWEIIFWDNCSTDRTQEIINSYNDVRIKYFRGKETVPLGCARNYALEKAQGEFISFLDVDDIWKNIKLSEEINIFMNNPQVGFVFSRYEMFTENISLLSDSNGSNRYVSVIELLKNYTVGMSAAVIRSNIIKNNNIIFNTNFSLIEDYDFFLRIACHTKVYYIGTILMRYRQHGNNMSRTSDRWGQEFESLIDVIKTEKDNYPLLQSQIKEIKKQSIKHNIYSLVIRRERWKALRQIAVYFYVFPCVLRYLIPVFLGENVYNKLRKIIKRILWEK
jgi:glycosyltransferase involved in cell wall biosynthesis